MASLTPGELIVARSDAFQRGDFGFIYDSCHPESNFRCQFTERQSYVCFGKSVLSQEYRINGCRVLAEDVGELEARVIFLMEVAVQEKVELYAELAWLRKEGGGWRYHRGLKMSADELPPRPESLSFSDFAKLDPNTIF